MQWTFEKTFFGNKGPLNLKQVKTYLANGYCQIPYTRVEGYYKAVCRVGDHDSLYAQVQKPFPDELIAQKPQGKFALLLSGGYDSAILAKLYDRPDVDYIHFTGPESDKARALVDTLQGTLREIQVTPEKFIEAADAIVGRFIEPYAYEDVVFAYIASQKAKELGHTLVVAGDGGDGVLGGYSTGPYSRKSLMAWKTIEPNRLLGLQTLQPFLHSGPYAWSKATLDPREVARDKRFARRFCRELGMPEIVTEQKKVPWAGSIGIREDQKIFGHMQAVVQASDYRWLTEFDFPTPPRPALLFRQYSLVKWLEANWGTKPTQHESRAIRERIDQLDAADREQARRARMKERIRRLVPPLAIEVSRKIAGHLSRS